MTLFISVAFTASSPAVALDFCGRATAVGSFERSGFLTDTICPKAPPGALASTAIAYRCARVWVAARNTYGTNRTQPKTIRQTFASCALNALFLLRCLFACRRYTFLVGPRATTDKGRPAGPWAFLLPKGMAAKKQPLR